MVLTIEENTVDIARHAEHTVASAHGEWITSAQHARLYTYIPTIPVIAHSIPDSPSVSRAAAWATDFRCFGVAVVVDPVSASFV
jgi:hypothetical protein